MTSKMSCFTKIPKSSPSSNPKVLHKISNPKVEASMIRPRSSAHPATNSTLKFFCSYGGKILPRYPDNKLRYVGGTNRLVAVPRSISFSRLLSKLEELTGATVDLRCQLPTDDLATLISITNDEDLKDIINEYNTAATPMKIRAILTLLPAKKPPSSSALSTSKSSSSNNSTTTTCASGNIAKNPKISMPLPTVRCPCPRPVSHTAAVRRAPAEASKAHPHFAKNHAHGNPIAVSTMHVNNDNAPYAWKWHGKA